MNNQKTIQKQIAKPALEKIEKDDPVRLAAIRAALSRLKRKNEIYLQKMQMNDYWRKIYNGLVVKNYQNELKQLVTLQICQVKNPEKSYFNPYQKTPITICYNKINDIKNFQKQLLYNLILHYDNKTKSETDWNNVIPTAKSTIRALHISGICQRSDKICFKDQLEKRVTQKERFKDKPFDFTKTFDEAMSDFEPISQVIFNN